jgi:hypothetical protein
MDKNKCPKLKIQKNFPQKISYIDTTHGGTFFATFFKKSRFSLHYVVERSLSRKINNILKATSLGNN